MNIIEMADMIGDISEKIKDCRSELKKRPKGSVQRIIIEYMDEESGSCMISLEKHNYKDLEGMRQWIEAEIYADRNQRIEDLSTTLESMINEKECIKYGKDKANEC